jgi:hypothetical protein
MFPLVELVSSVIRLELRPGEWVLWKARPFRFVSLHGSTASIRDSVNAELHEFHFDYLPIQLKNRGGLNEQRMPFAPQFSWI